MQYAEKGPEGSRMFMVKIEPGEQVAAGLREFARAHGIRGAMVSGLGAVSDAELAWFNRDKKKYYSSKFPEVMELLSLTGNLGMKEDGPVLHAHAVCCGQDLQPVGGHLVEAVCAVTVEVFMAEAGFAIERKQDPRFGLWLMNLRGPGGR